MVAPTNLETFAFLTGVLWIALLIMDNAWGWPVGIISSATYVLLFYQGKLYGDAGINIVYVVLGILGWYWWSRGIDRARHLDVARASVTLLALLGIGAVFGTALLVPHFVKAQSPVPIPDALLFCLAAAAQFLQARKKIENWPLWIAVDLGYVALYIYRQYYATAILTVVFAIMAIVGWRQWMPLLQRERAEVN
jgi:nicotinamide mononucleotide transporter